MRAAIAQAEVGDDVYGEDPTVAALEAKVADLFGFEAALFVPTGVMANHIALRMQLPAGSELVADADAHILAHEDAGLAWHGGIQTRTALTPDGLLTPEDVSRLIRPHLPHTLGTGAVELENTHNRGGGSVYTIERLRAIRAIADERGVSVHIDGARIWNAHVATGTPLREYGAVADTMSVCLSKGLGAPVGSVALLKPQQRAQAVLMRHRLGGGWRQAGMLAAAGIYALDHHVDRLAEDHANARLLAAALREAGLSVRDPQTNIVLVDVPDAPALAARAARRNVRISAFGPALLRLVTHLDVTEKDCVAAAQVLAHVA
ncbi:threonine aldolase family protein [Actinocrinis puniceicyclus]|uniref:Threonine aldolase family protein n=2 Tax=Actinocrinis puniceicyclus TaxID=977794 RepID=A0A8J7WNJ7_9ACTN|nr:threonine aldolase family protein [Actinocrinis puniceicyclus]